MAGANHCYSSSLCLKLIGLTYLTLIPVEVKKTFCFSFLCPEPSIFYVVGDHSIMDEDDGCVDV